MTYKDDEVRKEFKEQTKPVKPPIDIGFGRRHLSLLQSCEILFNSCANEMEFTNRLLEEFPEITYGSPQYAAALEAYRAYRAGLR